jgi:hypothetical protein
MRVETDYTQATVDTAVYIRCLAVGQHLTEVEQFKLSVLTNMLKRVMVRGRMPKDFGDYITGIKMLEKDIQTKIIKYLKSIGAYVIKTQMGIYTSAGTPDIIACYKGVFIAFEVKSEKGKTTALQELHIKEIKKSGGHAEVVRSVSDVCKYLDKWFV